MNIIVPILTFLAGVLLSKKVTKIVQDVIKDIFD